jgi:thiamine biosynthesis lipoprotein
MTPSSSPSALSPEHARAIHHAEHVMGTVVTFDIFLQNDVAPPDIYVRLAKARAILRRADAIFSIWKKDSPMSRMRRGEATPEQCPFEVVEVLEACAAARSASQGWFDPWAMPGGVDPTGFVKGWAAQRALSMIDTPGVSGAIVNAAGDVAVCGGLQPGTPFRVGVVDPWNTSRLACVVDVEGAIATSGTYQRGEHLIDPWSRRSIARVASASVSGPECGTADALATALAVAGEEGLVFIDALEGYEAFVIGLDGSLAWTEHFPFASNAPQVSHST